MPSYILTQAAEQDLIDIWRYTNETWGEKQADRYLDRLETSCETLKNEKVLWKSFDDIQPGLKSLRCEHHYLFFLSTKDKKPVIVAVLHERMNLIERLKKRI